MDENKKYPVVGTVTISTEEYKDLVHTALKSEREASDNLSRAWKAETACSEAKKAAEAHKSELDKFMAFMRENPDIYMKYCTWLADQKEAE